MTMTKKKPSANKSSTKQSVADSSPGTETSPETTSKIELDAQAETGSKANSETKAKADADAKAKADAEEKAKADAKAKASVLTKSISVRSKSKQGFRRAGFAFGPEPKIIPLNNLDDAKLKALNNEPNLIVEDVE
jgi:membrane protein involved in colicin uptake